MANKIILVGPTTQNNTVLNGQSMLFQLLVDDLIEKKIDFKILDIGISTFKSEDDRISGKFTINKSLNYIPLFFKYFWLVIKSGKSSIYITTAQSKVGFIRDYFFINIAKLFGNKVIAHQFGANYAGFYQAQSPFIQNKIKKTLHKTDLIVVEGEFTKNQFSFLPNFENKVIVIQNGLPQKFASNIQPKKLNTEKVELIYLSNLIETKGYWDVLEAVNILVNDFKINIEIVFSGKFLESSDDSTFANAMLAKKAFFQFIKDNNLQDNVIHLDGIYGEKKALEFAKAKFFILPSYYINEGQPVSVLEALAYGCVPIVTKYRLIPEMVNDKNGFFVNPKSPKEIANIIRKTIQEPEKYEQYSKGAIDFYLDNFAANKYTSKLTSFL
ncbi:glycosyltransferase [Flavobacterium psychrophilum]|uniref:glycosyltransferase family 4 protein n=1 Tax=Flavobacterium psychrophilum TaxID=96345 RepID=UPI001D092C95|nr:glycosyltransferase [Flavobacterium psychrophilum]MCB5981800.1 glycosyltransferase [Flavobacterium psychrophilum]MCB5984438.1 glycosyltransferase [Flavobacterium psychrophilum]